MATFTQATESEQARIETDLLGARSVPTEALWGIHTARAVYNFQLAGRPVRRALVRAYGQVKWACAQTNRELGYLRGDMADAVLTACAEMASGGLDNHVVVDALQGGAGTSTNMNVNEVLANRALELLNEPHGRYDLVSPYEHVNLHQSTNDTVPTALRVAAIGGIRALESALVELMEAFQGQERELSDVVKVGRTEFQDAVLTTLGREMGAYAEAIARDRWRIHKAEERLRVVNLGGTAIGTGLGAPRAYIFRVVDKLREVTGYGLARAENLVEATQNCDVIVEVSGLLKTLAANLLKICGDLRLLSSGPSAGIGELRLPPCQSGSSIMPGKVNPVIPEAVSQVALEVFGADSVITLACAMGSLELNPFLPLIAERLLESLELLERASRRLARSCVAGLRPNRVHCAQNVNNSTAAVTALVPILGYARAESLAEQALSTGRTVRELATECGWLSVEQFEQLTSAAKVNQLGFVPEEPQ